MGIRLDPTILFTEFYAQPNEYLPYNTFFFKIIIRIFFPLIHIYYKKKNFISKMLTKKILKNKLKLLMAKHKTQN